jgi:uncharacterized membrane protein YecN with MAPEG domain
MIQNLSIPSVQAATFYAALLALGALILALLVVRKRVETNTGLRDGGHAGLAQMIRVHGNYIENVPFGLALLIMLAVTDPSARAWRRLMSGCGAHCPCRGCVAVEDPVPAAAPV